MHFSGEIEGFVENHVCKPRVMFLLYTTLDGNIETAELNVNKKRSLRCRPGRYVCTGRVSVVVSETAFGVDAGRTAP